MAHVGVHVDGDLKPVAAGLAESLEDRAAEAAAAAADEHVQSRFTSRPLQGDAARAVGRVVVDDEHVQVVAGGEHPVDQRGDVLLLVVGRGIDDELARGPRLGRAEVAARSVVGGVGSRRHATILPTGRPRVTGC